jgi:hypothetical protein
MIKVLVSNKFEDLKEIKGITDDFFYYTLEKIKENEEFKTWIINSELNLKN